MTSGVPASARNLLEFEFEKWDRDFHFLLDRFTAVLASTGDDELAGLVTRAFAHVTPPPGACRRAPRRLSRSLSNC